MQQKQKLIVRCDFENLTPASLLLNMAYVYEKFYLKLKKKYTSAGVWVTKMSKPIVKYRALVGKIGAMRAILLVFL